MNSIVGFTTIQNRNILVSFPTTSTTENSEEAFC